MILLVVKIRSGYNRIERAERPPKLPAAGLSIGSAGKLNALQYRVTGHAVVEVAHVGKRYLRHEYFIADEAGNEALLWQGTEQGASKWMLVTPFAPAQPLTPAAAGALRLGQPVLLNDAAANVTDFFLSRVGKVEGAAKLPAGKELYGFAARNSKGADKAAVVARWNGSEVTFYRIARMVENPAKTFR